MAGIHMLRAVADGLGDMLPEVAFVGGATVDVYCTAPRVGELHVTDDVDLVVEITSLTAYYDLETKLRNRGFSNDIESNILVRWKYRGIVVDVMPTDLEPFGFYNPWYAAGFRSTYLHTLANGQQIRVFAIEYFLASKLTALFTRGWNGLRWSKDWEDIIQVMLYRPELTTEIQGAKADVKHYIAESCGKILIHEDFEEATDVLAPIGSTQFAVSRVQEILLILAAS